MLCFLFVRRLTGRQRIALVVTAAWGIGIGLLNVFERPWLVFYSWYFPVPPLVALLLYPWLAGVWRRRHEPAPTDEEPIAQPDLTANAWPIAIAITIAAMAIMVWHLLAPQPAPGFAPTDNAGWGVSFYQALPWPLQLLGLAIVATALLWAIRSPMAPANATNSKLRIQDSIFPRLGALGACRRKHGALRPPACGVLGG